MHSRSPSIDMCLLTLLWWGLPASHHCPTHKQLPNRCSGLAMLCPNMFRRRTPAGSGTGHVAGGPEANPSVGATLRDTGLRAGRGRRDPEEREPLGAAETWQGLAVGAKAALLFELSAGPPDRRDSGRKCIGPERRGGALPLVDGLGAREQTRAPGAVRGGRRHESRGDTTEFSR